MISSFQLKSPGRRHCRRGFFQCGCVWKYDLANTHVRRQLLVFEFGDLTLSRSTIQLRMSVEFWLISSQGFPALRLQVFGAVARQDGDCYGCMTEKARRVRLKELPTQLRVPAECFFYHTPRSCTDKRGLWDVRPICYIYPSFDGRLYYGAVQQLHALEINGVWIYRPVPTVLTKLSVSYPWFCLEMVFIDSHK